MRVMRGGHFWQFGSIASLATESTDGEIFWPKHGLRSDLRVTNLKNFPGGACPQTPLAYSQLSAWNGRTSIKYLAPALYRSLVASFPGLPRFSSSVCVQ